MATLNPVRAAWDFLRGEDLKARVPAAPESPTPEVKLLTFTTETYDGQLADALGPTVAQVFGGYGLDYNSAVFACLRLIAQSFQEAPLRVYRRQGDGTEERLDDHPFTDLMADPHPSLSEPELNFWLQYSKHCNGNAYLRKIRSRANRVVQLWPISPTQLWPETTDEDRLAGVFISHYVLDDGRGNREEVPVADIIHFRLGVDDRDHRLGLSPLKRLLREISSDEEATRFTDALLKNFAVPSLAVSLPPGPTLSEDQAKQIRDRLREEYGGRGRGQIAVVANGATLNQIGFNPQQLEMKSGHEHAEARICAVLGVPPMLVGLRVGLEHTIYNNMEQAQEHLYEQTIVPLWRADAATLTKQLLRPDFGAGLDVRLTYDQTDVRALQEDMNEIYARLSVAVEKGWVTADEARAEVGLEPLPNGLGESPAPPPQLTPPDDEEDEGDGEGTDLEQRMRRLLGERKALGLGAIPGMLDALHDLTAPLVEADLEAYFRGQQQRVLRRARRQGGGGDAGQ